MRNSTVTRAVAAVATSATLVGLLLAGQAQAAPAEQPQVPCALPSAGGAPERSEPQAQRLDPAAVRDAIAYAQTNMRTSIRIYRNNCLVGTSPLDPLTQNVPMNVWSSTKSVVSMATGIAYGQGKLSTTRSATTSPTGRVGATTPTGRSPSATSCRRPAG